LQHKKDVGVLLALLKIRTENHPNQFWTALNDRRRRRPRRVTRKLFLDKAALPIVAIIQSSPLGCSPHRRLMRCPYVRCVEPLPDCK
jgi:hypothetical protein